MVAALHLPEVMGAYSGADALSSQLGALFASATKAGGVIQSVLLERSNQRPQSSEPEEPGGEDETVQRLLAVIHAMAAASGSTPVVSALLSLAGLPSAS